MLFIISKDKNFLLVLLVKKTAVPVPVLVVAQHDRNCELYGTAFIPFSPTFTSLNARYQFSHQFKITGRHFCCVLI
jgi:hypothetical protein